MIELPIAACGLDAAGMREQGARYARLGEHVARRTREPRLLEVVFDAGVDRALLEETARVERGCCSFFGIEVEGRRLRMTVADDAQDPALDAIAAALAL